MWNANGHVQNLNAGIVYIFLDDNRCTENASIQLHENDLESNDTLI